MVIEVLSHPLIQILYICYSVHNAGGAENISVFRTQCRTINYLLVTDNGLQEGATVRYDTRLVFARFKVRIRKADEYFFKLVDGQNLPC